MATCIKPFINVTCITHVKLKYSTAIPTSTQCQGLSKHVYQIQYGLYQLYGIFQVSVLMSALYYISKVESRSVSVTRAGKYYSRGERMTDMFLM